jgi:hypothetical protein
MSAIGCRAGGEQDRVTNRAEGVDYAGDSAIPGVLSHSQRTIEATEKGACECYAVYLP